MNFLTTSAIVVAALAAVPAMAAEKPGAYVGEVRMLAVARGDRSASAQLQREGWVEANGQLLDVARHEALYQRIGRTWTAEGVARDRFAVPRLEDSTQRARSSDNPFGVLGPGDLVTSGRARPVTSRRSPLSYWIFAGTPAKDVGADGPGQGK
jgi:Phage Tail Collar Domain